MKILYCASDSSGDLFPQYNYQCYVSLSSLYRQAYLNSLDLPAAIIVSSHPEFWKEILDSDRLLNPEKISVVNASTFTYHTNKHLKLVSISHYVEDAGPIAFIDTDTLFFSPPVFMIGKFMDFVYQKKIDLAAALECGATSVTSSNYNTGLLLLLGSNSSRNLINMWESTYRRGLEESGHDPKRADQPYFSWCLHQLYPKVFTLHEIHNLRCHPVYSESAYVWSPVVMIHNHRLSNLVVNTHHKHGISDMHRLLSKLSLLINPGGSKATANYWKPRLICIESIVRDLGFAS